MSRKKIIKQDRRREDDGVRAAFVAECLGKPLALR